MNKRAVAIAALVVLAVLAALAALLRSWPLVPQTSGPLAHHAYVWQQLWMPETCKAVAAPPAALGRLVVLAAVVHFGTDGPDVQRVDWDAAAVKASSRQVGLAIRVGPYRGPFDPAGKPAALLTNLAAGAVARARQAGIEPAEVHLDFDCPESKLDGYRVWVEAIRPAVAPVPLTITALPSWLDAPGAGKLLAATDGYVLQVHSIELVVDARRPDVLCDVAAARRAVARAARFAVPFRVALPTYGYLAAMDPNGRLLGLRAEGPDPHWGEYADLRRFQSDPAAMAELVRQWTAGRPACMSGIIWYRLPVATDRLNWRAATLAAVMAGRTPRARLLARTRRPKPGLVEIDLANEGDADADLPMTLAVRWGDARLVASDALGGFSQARGDDGALLLTRRADPLAPAIGPGQRRTVGWLRLSAETEVRADVLPPTAH